MVESRAAAHLGRGLDGCFGAESLAEGSRSGGQALCGRLRRSQRERSAARREHTECDARTHSGRGVSSSIAPFYFLCTVRLDALDLGSTNAWAPGERLSPSNFH